MRLPVNRIPHYPNAYTDMNEENKRGSDCSGSDGAVNRVLTLSNTAMSDYEQVYVNGVHLHPTADYTVTHNAASSTVTFLNAIDDSMYIRVFYVDKVA